jgi:hypothetical protein
VSVGGSRDLIFFIFLLRDSIFWFSFHRNAEQYMVKYKKSVSRNSMRFQGCAAAARRLGCTRQHVWQVWAGLRQSKRVEALKPLAQKNT